MTGRSTWSSSARSTATTSAGSTSCRRPARPCSAARRRSAPAARAATRPSQRACSARAPRSSRASARDDDGGALAEDLAEAWVDTTEWPRPSMRTGMAFVHRRRARRERDRGRARARTTWSRRSTTARAVRELPRARPACVVTQAEIPAPAFDAAVRAAGGGGCPRGGQPGAVPAGRRTTCSRSATRWSSTSRRPAACSGATSGARSRRSTAVGRAGRRAARSVVVTVGADGALVVGRRPARGACPAGAGDAVDTTGAGDAFTGALAAALGAGSRPRRGGADRRACRHLGRGPAGRAGVVPARAARRLPPLYKRG